MTDTKYHNSDSKITKLRPVWRVCRFPLLPRRDKCYYLRVMSAFPKRIGKHIRPTVAAFLAMWLSGVVFLLCCQQVNGAKSIHGFCPMAKMGGHCNKTKGNATPSWYRKNTDDQCLAGCAYLPVVFDKSRKVEKARKQTAPSAAVLFVRFSAPAAARIESARAQSYNLLFFDDRILAKNCILRI